MALKPRMSVQLPMNLLIYQNSKVKVSLWKNTIILVNGAALTRNILFSRLDLSKDPGPFRMEGAGVLISIELFSLCVRAGMRPAAAIMPMLVPSVWDDQFCLLLYIWE